MADEMTWSEARSIASNAKRQAKAWEKIFEACDIAVKAEEYMRQKHTEKSAVDASVASLHKKLEEMQAEYDTKSNSYHNDISNLEAQARAKSDEVDQTMRDLENSVAKKKASYEQEIKDFERKLTAESEKLKKALEEEMIPKRKAAQDEIHELNRQAQQVRDEVAGLEREKVRVAQAIAKLKESVAGVGV